MNRKFLFAPLLLAIVAAAELEAQPSQDAKCKNTITLLPQDHRNMMARGAEDPTNSEIAESQFRIARYLQAHPRVPVFSEQMVQNMVAADLTPELKAVAEQSKKLFPNGVPATYEELSSEQKKHLFYNGADGVLLLTGKIPMLRKVVPNANTQNLIVNQVDRAMQERNDDVVTGEIVTTKSVPYQLITTVRERYALKEIANFFSYYPKEKNAILIFGRMHDFRRHDDIFPRGCIITPDF